MASANLKPKERLVFGNVDPVLPMPDLLDIQIASYKDFLQEDVLPEKRENKGIWGGLWSFPELDSNKNIEQWCNNISQDIKKIEYGKIINHGFSHFDLDITPVVIDIKNTMTLEDHHVRFTKKEISKLGVPKPVKSLINQLK